MPHDTNNRVDIPPEDAGPILDPTFHATRTVRNAETAARARRTQFATIEEFEKWRRSKNFPELSRPDLEAAFARFRGEAPGEKAMLIPDRETRTVSAGDAGVHFGKKL